MPAPSHRRGKSSINARSANSTSASSSHRRRRRPRQLVVILRSVWLAAVFWAEVGIFAVRIWTCRWPEVANGTGGGAKDRGIKVLVVADPQLPAMGYTYPDRGWVARLLSLRIIEQYLRKVWRMTIRSAKPDAVVFLGDLLDGGVEAIDRREYAAYVHRFHRTFPSAAQTLASPSDHPLLHLAGNHDVGLIPDTTPGHSALARERFIHTWEPGALQGAARWGAYEIVWIDAVGLLEEKRRGEGPRAATRFVSGLGTSVPRVLFTHVPLYRPEGTPCGPYRESPRPLRQGGGLNYQNEMDEDLSTSILRDIQPSLIFSGDDHDYCVTEHTTPGGSAIEVTVKSLSMAMGVRNPGYLLLSLPSSSTSTTSPLPPASSLYKPCLLPSQIDLYVYFYLPLFLVTAAVLFGSRAYRALTTSRRVHARQNGLPIHGHRRSLSRTLLFGVGAVGGGGGRRPGSPRIGGSFFGAGSDDDDDGMVSDYPTPTRAIGGFFNHHHSASIGAGGGYGNGGAILDEDVEAGPPTRATGDVFGPGDPRSRRVSRMLLDGGQTGGGEAVVARVSRPPLGSARKGIGARAVAMAQEGIRRVVGPKAAMAIARLGHRVRQASARVTRNPLVRGGAKDVARTLWPAAGVYVLVWAYFSW